MFLVRLPFSALFLLCVIIEVALFLHGMKKVEAKAVSESIKMLGGLSNDVVYIGCHHEMGLQGDDGCVIRASVNPPLAGMSCQQV